MRILGLSAFYHDSGAVLVEDGFVTAAAQEERFTRKKHDAAFPRHALRYCLEAGGIGPEELDLDGLARRVETGEIREVILATNATVDGQATAHYIGDRLSATGVRLTRLARGVPLGGELDYLDDGTLSAALKARRPA